MADNDPPPEHDLIQPLANLASFPPLYKLFGGNDEANFLETDQAAEIFSGQHQKRALKPSSWRDPNRRNKFIKVAEDYLDEFFPTKFDVNRPKWTSAQKRHVWEKLNDLTPPPGLDLEDHIIDAFKALFRTDVAGNVVSFLTINGGLTSFHIDHIVPWARSVCDEDWNLMALYWKANNKKSDRFIQVMPRADLESGLAESAFWDFVTSPRGMPILHTLFGYDVDLTGAWQMARVEDRAENALNKPAKTGFKKQARVEIRGQLETIVEFVKNHEDDLAEALERSRDAIESLREYARLKEEEDLHNRWSLEAQVCLLKEDYSELEARLANESLAWEERTGIAMRKAQDLENDNSQLEGNIDDLEARNEGLEEEIKTKTKKIERLEEEVVEIEDNNDLVSKIADIEFENDELRKKIFGIAELYATVERLDEDIDNRDDEINRKDDKIGELEETIRHQDAEIKELRERVAGLEANQSKGKDKGKRKEKGKRKGKGKRTKGSGTAGGGS